MIKLQSVQPIRTLWTNATEANLDAGGSGSSSERDLSTEPIDRFTLFVDLNNVDNDIRLEGKVDGEWYELYRLALGASTSRNLSATIWAPFGTHIRFVKSGTAGSVLSVKIQPIYSQVLGKAVN